MTPNQSQSAGSAQERELGSELCRIRKRANVTGREIARILHSDKSIISRIENGARQVSELDVAMYLVTCRASEEEFTRLTTLARQITDGPWLRAHGDALPDELRSLIFQENTASAITNYVPLLIPGLLQTEDYAREVFRWAGLVPADGIDMRVRARLARQQLLHRPQPPALTFYLHEHALRSPVGSATVMHDQLRHLLLVGARTSCTLRAIPHARGPIGILGGAFMLIDHAEHPSLAYVEAQTASVFTEEPADIAAYRQILTKLDALALDAEQSRKWVAHLATNYERAKDGNGDGRAGLA